MGEIGTLKELNVKPGDVVEWPGISEYVVQEDGITVISTVTGRELKNGINYSGAKFSIISRSTPDTPKLWRDMTAEEKGALLLAHHEGKVIECFHDPVWITITSPIWSNSHTYRVKPEPKVEQVQVLYSKNGTTLYSGNAHKYSHKITFNTVDGVPDETSVKMEKL